MSKTLRKWLEEERGRAAALAKHLEISAVRVSQMATDGVPTKYMISVRQFTKNEVSLEEMIKARYRPQAPRRSKAKAEA